MQFERGLNEMRSEIVLIEMWSEKGLNEMWSEIILNDKGLNAV